MNGDLLNSVTPARLLCRRGTWILELVRLVAVDRNVFQPKTQRLEGSDAVLQHLKRNVDNPSLAASASQLMRGLRPDEERNFEAVDGDWVPTEPGARRDSSRPSAPPPGSSFSSDLAEMRAELLVLRASHERLRERVVKLEAQLLAGVVPPREVLSTAPTPAVGMRQASDVPRLDAFPATLIQGQAPRVTSEAPRAQSVSPEVSPSQAPRNRSAKPGADALTMMLPAADEVSACLRSLIGEQVVANERHPAQFSLADRGERWISRLIDDEGQEVGAVIADLQATTGLGGALLMLVDAEIQAQRDARAPTEDVLSAMSEVSNNLSGTINQQPDSVHVRVKPLEPLNPATLEWGRAPSSVLELELGGGGHLFLLAR